MCLINIHFNSDKYMRNPKPVKRYRKNCGVFVKKKVYLLIKQIFSGLKGQINKENTEANGLE